MTIGVEEHPLREQLVNELRARPYVALNLPERVSQISMLSGEHGQEGDWAHVADLCRRYNIAPPEPKAKHFVGDLGPVRIRWERHTEFSSYTLYRAEDFDDPFDRPATDYVPKDWLEGLPGQLMTAIHIAFETSDKPERSQQDLAYLFKGNQHVGSRIGGGAATAYSDLRLDDDRFVRFLVREVTPMLPNQAGRICQRLLEMETYRTMALLALPLAHEASPRIRKVDQGLAKIATEMANVESTISDADLLDKLSALAAEIEDISAANSYRFGAANAYYDIVKNRLEELREVRIEGTQTFEEFLERRLAPAMQSCEYTAQRQHNLSQRVSRVASLLRARVEVGLEQHNSELLKTMNQRAETQLRLQETVEGLSVVAISYYLVGLLGYVFKGLKAFGLPINPELAVALAIPIVVVMIWKGIRVAKKALLHKTD